MNKKEIVLVALVPANGDIHTPVQVQKLLFLIDRNVTDTINGEHFNFSPYSYGPFDIEVYKTLEQLGYDDFVEINREETWETYRLTVKGQERGNQLFEPLDETVRNYVIALSEFVHKLTFNQLVSAIYKAYPEMRVNSVFRD